MSNNSSNTNKGSGETRSIPVNEGVGIGQNPPPTSKMPGFPGGNNSGKNR